MQRACLKLLSVLLASGPLTSGLCSGPPGVARAESPGEPPRFSVTTPTGTAPLTFIAYGDTRFSEHEDIANPLARQALVEKIASENPAAILIGGDLVYEGRNPGDYETYRNETSVWAQKKIPVFPALGNHEFLHCSWEDTHVCLENWWQAFSSLPLRPYRWYSVAIGPTLLALLLDSDSALTAGSPQRSWLEEQITNAGPRVLFILIVMHYPPVREPFYPSAKDEKEVERYLTAKAGSLHARVIVVGSHVHNYERYRRHGVTYLVSGGGGAKPVPAVRMFGELSRLTTRVNYHYVRFTLDGTRLTGTMVRFDAEDRGGHPWSEPDRFEIRARD